VQSIQEIPVPADGGQQAHGIWRLHGTVSDLRIVDKTSWCALLGPMRNCIYGDWVGESGEDCTAQFETCCEPAGVVAGTHLPNAGDMLAWSAILVEDGLDAWKEITFEAKDAIETRFVDEGGKPWRKLAEFKEGGSIDLGANVVHGGWDHEHCMICNAHIDPGDRFYMHRTENEFVCVTCHERHVATGDLSFLIPAD
jgi:hypothetical protein